MGLGEKTASHIIMRRTEHEELQITEQLGFVPPSRLGANQSERLATETKELTAVRLARFSANHSKTNYGD